MFLCYNNTVLIQELYFIKVKRASYMNNKQDFDQNEDSKQNNKKQQGSELLHGLMFFSQIGISMVACVFIGVFLGRFLDKLLGTSPWLLLIFSLMGAAAAIKVLFDLSKKK